MDTKKTSTWSQIGIHLLTVPGLKAQFKAPRIEQSFHQQNRVGGRMRILVLSDIHANWPALCAVSEAEPEFDACLVVGDLVDYATGARDVIAWVREYATAAIRGNHDHAVAQFIKPNEPTSGFKLLRNETRNHHWDSLKQRDLNYLSQLPLTSEIELDGLSFYLVHASPRDPLNEYLQNDSEVWALRTEQIDADIICVGHSHQSYICELANGKRILNAGSVGQPRDGNPQASYAIIENGEIQIKRVSYDIAKTIDQMRDAKLSDQAITAATRILFSGSTEMPDDEFTISKDTTNGQATVD